MSQFKKSVKFKMNREEFEKLGDRMKRLESVGAGGTFDNRTPLVVRLDGHCFHTFTKGLERPFDKNFRQCMTETTKYLVKTTDATLGYTQSDEITLVFIPKTLKNGEMSNNIPFNGRKDKLISLFAARASAKFNQMVAQFLPKKSQILAEFDCRGFNVQSEEQAQEVLIWREADAIRNSIAMLSQSVFSHKELQGAGIGLQLEMLNSKSIQWAEYPLEFQRGTYVKRQTVLKELSPEELSKIPDKNKPKGPVARTEIVAFNFEQELSKIENVFKLLA